MIPKKHQLAATYLDAAYQPRRSGDERSAIRLARKHGLESPLFSGLKNNAEWMIGRIDRELWIILPGSNDRRDWLSNIAAIYSSFMGFWFHLGFSVYYQKLRPVINQRVRAGDFSRVVITGHSLGGAAAKLAAIDLRQQHPELEIEVITFGMPRIVWWWSRRQVAAIMTTINTTHYVTPTDPVPLLPWGSLGWRNVTPKTVIKPNGAIASQKVQWLKRFAAWVLAWAKSKKNPLEVVESHFVSHYGETSKERTKGNK